MLPPQMQDKIKIQIIELQQLLLLPPHPLLLPRMPLPLLPHPPQQNKRMIIHHQLSQPVLQPATSLLPQPHPLLFPHPQKNRRIMIHHQLLLPHPEPIPYSSLCFKKSLCSFILCANRQNIACLFIFLQNRFSL